MPRSSQPGVSSLSRALSKPRSTHHPRGRRAWRIGALLPGAAVAMLLGVPGCPGALMPGAPVMRSAERVERSHSEGRLRARPEAAVTRETPRVGRTHTLALTAGRPALLYVPAGYRGARPAPVVVMLHGAGGRAEHGLRILQRYADGAGFLLLAPASRASTWDVIAGSYGPDVAALDEALTRVFRDYAVDARRLAIGGFSDGASYALSLGVTNGDLFTHVIALSPGFMAPAAQRGSPRVFVSHGTLDRVLPIDRCSRRIVPRLRASGYLVHYREFVGPHTVPRAISREAVDWFIGADPPAADPRVAGPPAGSRL
jgi:phospholipase/carboxylesterase